MASKGIESQLRCAKSPLNLTFAAMLLAGPSILSASTLEDYYDFYASPSTIETWWQIQSRRLNVHVDLMIEVLLQADGMKSLKSRQRLMLNILNLALQRVNPMLSLKDFPKPPDHFLYRFFHWFNEFTTSFQVYATPSATDVRRRNSMQQIHMQAYALPNAVMETIAENGLWCTSGLHSFSDWLTQMFEMNWFDGLSAIPTPGEIQYETEIARIIILEWKYRQFLNRLCQIFPFHHCALQMTLHQELSKLSTEQHVPFNERLIAFEHFQKYVVARLHQIEMQLPSGISLSAYIDELEEKGKNDQNHQEEKWIISPRSSKDFVHNLNVWRKMKTPHFVYDMEQGLRNPDIDDWHF